MFKSLGNVLENPAVRLLFIDFEKPRRPRGKPLAGIEPDDRLLSSCHGAQLVIRVRAEHIFPNGPRYIHRMPPEEFSVYAPEPGHEPPVPAWKQMDAFRDYLPR